ncbi:MAG: small, acid-soluble spore protein, alpha/beta type [Peptococcales bacterium]
MAHKKEKKTNLNKFKYEVAQEMGLNNNLKKQKNKTDNSK